MIILEAEDIFLPNYSCNQALYEENWKIMASIKQQILTLRPQRIKEGSKLYHENGLRHLFSCVHKKLTQAMKGNNESLKSKDIQYPLSEEVDREEVYTDFKKLQIPGIDHIIIDSDDKPEDGDDDEDDSTNKRSPPKDGGKKDSQNPPRSDPSKELQRSHMILPKTKT
ncbi:hypothetical protein L7F22_065994 [Adiantum nelumboides]|nr:hypothetical protein [Adiantum nelumboides]